MKFVVLLFICGFAVAFGAAVHQDEQETVSPDEEVVEEEEPQEVEDEEEEQEADDEADADEEDEAADVAEEENAEAEEETPMPHEEMKETEEAKPCKGECFETEDYCEKLPSELPLESPHSEGMCHWKPVVFETFEKGAFGWTNNSVSDCGGCSDSGSNILGGPCRLGGQEVSKTFDGLPEHNFIRVVGRYYFLDDWNKETGYAKLDDHLVWTKRGTDASWKGLSLCGGVGTDFVGIPMDVIMAHNDDCIKVTFGSNLKGDPCTASYGVGPVQIYTCTHTAKKPCGNKGFE